jgi:hypothetical protein
MAIWLQAHAVVEIPEGRNEALPDASDGALLQPFGRTVTATEEWVPTGFSIIR